MLNEKISPLVGDTQPAAPSPIVPVVRFRLRLSPPLPRATGIHENMDTRRAIEPDMSTNPGINITPIMGSLFWGAFLLR